MAQREHVKDCLDLADENVRTIFDHVIEACRLLDGLITGVFNQSKVNYFELTVRRAQLEIKLGQHFLSEAKTIIDELTEITRTMKHFSRGVRFCGWGLSCYALYRIPATSTLNTLASFIPSFGLDVVRKIHYTVPFFVACAFSAHMWLSGFPNRTYALRDKLEKLKLKHRLLTIKLQYLEPRLELKNIWNLKIPR